MLYAFFWVIPRRLNFVCRRFGTLFHLHRQIFTQPPAYEDGTVFRNVGTKFRLRGNNPEESIQQLHGMFAQPYSCGSFVHWCWIVLKTVSILGRNIRVLLFFNYNIYFKFPDGVFGIFHWHNPSGRTVALRSTRPVTEMSMGMRRITTFRSTTDRIYDGGPIRL